MTAETITCAWCQTPFTRPGSRGTIPTYCSATCRQRAFEARRADERRASVKRLAAAFVFMAAYPLLELIASSQDWYALLGALFLARFPAMWVGVRELVYLWGRDR